MRTFDEILDLAGGHHGGAEAVLAKAKNDHAVGDITTVPDDRHLATMTRCVFCAGFNWKVIDTKWAGFEAAFEGFDPHKVAFYGDDALLKLLGDKRLVRNGQKLKATIDNARFVVTIAQGHGSFGRFLKAWPDDSQAELLAYLGKSGSRLGGATAQYFLRFTGWYAWIASKDVCAALMREGVLDKPTATSKTALSKIEKAINQLADQSDLPRATISRVLALSVG